MKPMLRASLLWLYFLLGPGVAGEIEDPFLLPFGPTHGDSFATREGCSLATHLNDTFKIGNSTVDKIYVCLDGVLKFSTPRELANPRWSDRFDRVDFPIIAPFLARHGLDDLFLDSKCLYSAEENSFYLGYYDSWCRSVYGDAFSDYDSLPSASNWLSQYDISKRVFPENQQELLKQLHSQSLTRDQLEKLVREDDETAREFFGKDSTKFVNLAENTMRRQVTQSEELDILTNLIRRKEESDNIMIEWALVVTWYKKKVICGSVEDYASSGNEYGSSSNEYGSSSDEYGSSSNEYGSSSDEYGSSSNEYGFSDYDYYSTSDYNSNRGGDLCFASFQLVMACGEHRCFSIMNYFEIDGTPLGFWGTFCDLRTTEAAEERKPPFQCEAENFSPNLLVNGSNIGVRGVWVYELDQSGNQTVMSPNELRNDDVTNQTSLTVHDFNNYEPEEPFLLKFGPKNNDKFQPQTTECYETEPLSRSFKFGILNVKSFRICHSGYVSFHSDYNDDEKGRITVLNFNGPDGNKNNFFDYTCLLFDNTLYQLDTYFNTPCFELASRNLFNPSEPFDITFDDETSKNRFGQLTTKYVNLAGNMFKRELTSSVDLEKIDQLVGQKIPGFQAKSGYVVTWYKIGRSRNEKRFNSFQIVIVCDDQEDAVVIFDYYEWQWGQGRPKIGAEDVWLSTNETNDLTNSTNFGTPGLWVFFFPGNGSNPTTNFELSQEETTPNSTTETVEDTDDEDEPFLLPFGPKHQDSFSYQSSEIPAYFKERQCTLPQILETPISLSGIQFDWLFACSRGAIRMQSFHSTLPWGDQWTKPTIPEYRQNYWHQTPIDANSYYDGTTLFSLKLEASSSSGYSEATLEDGSVDYLCAYAQRAADENDLHFQYLDYSFCPNIPTRWNNQWDWNLSVTMVGWQDKETLESVVDWNTEARHAPNVDVQSDDSLSGRIFGEETTKYINLANNVFHRESTEESDLQALSEFIRTKSENSLFRATWCLVATWYKVSSTNFSYSGTASFLQNFNSFQAITVCGNSTDEGQDVNCFAIYDYFQLETSTDPETIGFFDGESAKINLPAEVRDPSKSSNYGVPGKWVFDLNKTAENPVAEEHLIFYSERKLNNTQEPFLLPFGPNHGDFIFRKLNGYFCGHYVFEKGYAVINSRQFQGARLCTNGVVVFQDEDQGCGVWSHCRQPEFFVYPMTHVNTRDNLIDYACSEAYLDNEDRLVNWRFFTDEFCPLLEERVNHPLFFDEYAFVGGRMMATEQQRDAISTWNKNLPDPENLNIFSDDQLARTLLGADSTKFVNLAKNVFKRETREESDLTTLTSFLGEIDSEFEASWAFVATWYKIPAKETRNPFHYNSYQTIITCDQNSLSVKQDDVCYVIFDYFQIQWTGAERGRIGQCGIKENQRNFLELPNSGKEEVRNLWAQSNIGVPGMWVLSLSQGNDDYSIRMGKQGCIGTITPEKLAMYSIETTFTLSGFICFEVSANEWHPNVEVEFQGTLKTLVLTGTYDPVSGNVTCELLYWGKAEEVKVTLILDGEKQISPLAQVLFYNSADLLDPPPRLPVSFLPNMEVELTLNGVPGVEETSADIFASCLFMKPNGLDLNLDNYTVVPENNKLVLPNSRPIDSFSTMVCTAQLPSREKIYSELFKGEDGLSCESWINLEKTRNLSQCEQKVSTWYGCPREANSVPRESDSWYARQEVENGLMGWQYDVCCSDQELENSEVLSLSGFCTNCEFNPGARFCIKSVPLACLEGNTKKIHFVSNQCCYADDSLIEDNQVGVGTLHLEESARGNIVDHFDKDLQPFKTCCLDDDSSDGCDSFYEFRPVVKGSYWSRVVRAARGDPHITTIDNTTYTFNGLNVYTLLETNLSSPTQIQASTRVSGKGTLFSGFALKYKNTVFESFVTENGDFSVVINEKIVDLELLKSFKTSNIQITKNKDGSFTFFFTENDVIVKILITNSFLNFFISVPPTFHGRMKGLLGFYDGDPENDLLAADGTTLDVNSNLTTIHSGFGETWAVKRQNWIFTNELFVNGILQDKKQGSSYEPLYQPKFESAELEQAAKAACNNDSRCLLDVALTGEISMADVFAQTQAQISVLEVFNEIFHANVPNESLFQEVVDVEEEILEDKQPETGENNREPGNPNRVLGAGKLAGGSLGFLSGVIVALLAFKEVTM